MAAAHAAGAGDRVTDTQLTWAAAFADAGLEPVVRAGAPRPSRAASSSTPTPTSAATTPTGSSSPPSSFWRGSSARTRAAWCSRCTSPTATRPPTTPRSSGRRVRRARGGLRAPGPGRRALAEAERALDAGARGLKLHPRAEQFALADPRLEGTFAFADEHRLPVLVHAGRGIPALGRHAVELCERHPGLRIILAHAGISDLSWIWAAADELPNLFFDSSWWSAADLLALFTLVPPGQIVWASDAPYGTPLIGACIGLRCAQQAGLSGDRLRAVSGGTIAALVAGEEPPDLGPPIGTDRIDNDVLLARVETFLITALGRMLVGADGHEALQLARLACDVERGTKPAATCASVVSLLDRYDEVRAEHPDADTRVGLAFVVVAGIVARTPDVPLPTT